MGRPPKKKKPKRKPSAYNKHVGREMRAGKTMKQAAASWDKKSSKPKSKASPKKRSNPSGGTRKVGKSTFNMNKIYGLVRKASIFIPAASLAMRADLNSEQKIKQGVLWYFGWNMWTNTFDFGKLWNGWGPHVGAQIATRVVPAIGKIIRGLF